MAKEIVAHIKLQIPAGQANPAPPVGTALGPRGVNIMAFCKEFNAATQKQAGDKTKVGKVTRKQVMDIVNTKRKDLNARDDEAAFRIIAGTARQMGLEIAD